MNCKRRADAGIYEIRNTTTWHRYVGQSVSCKTRWGEHKSTLRASKHCNRFLQRAWDKYGEESFIFVKIEDTPADKSVMAEREEFHISLGAQYNIAPSAVSTLGVKFSDESKRRLSEAKRGQVISIEHRKKISESLKGRQISQETRDRLSISKKGKAFSDQHRANLSSSHVGNKHSEETRRKMSISRMGNKNAMKKIK